MIKKKIYMLGAFSVGKTSLMQRFVKCMFSEKYQTSPSLGIPSAAATKNFQV